jgi:hypothetical protein
VLTGAKVPNLTPEELRVQLELMTNGPGTLAFDVYGTQSLLALLVQKYTC